MMWSNVFKALFAWSKISWRKKASKWKRLTWRVQRDLTIQKARRETILRQSRVDIAQLLQNGQLQQARARVGRVYKDQCLLAAYDHVNELCECIMANISHITKHSSAQCLPIEVSQALASLIFAASRLGDLPELHNMRRLLKNRYGSKFETANVELLPENLVSSQMKESLCLNSVPEYVKQGLIDDIAEQYNIHLTIQDPGRSFRPNWQMEARVMDLETQDIRSDSDETSVPVLDCSSTNYLSPHRRTKNNAVMMENGKISCTSTSSDRTVSIRETSIVYLDDFEAKSVNQEDGIDGKHAARNAGPGSCNMDKKLSKPSLYGKSARTRTQLHQSSEIIPVSENLDTVQVTDCLYVDSSVYKFKTQNPISSPPHVHPKLPDYEDVLAKLQILKVESRRHKSAFY